MGSDCFNEVLRTDKAQLSLPVTVRPSQPHSQLTPRVSERMLAVWGRQESKSGQWEAWLSDPYIQSPNRGNRQGSKNSESSWCSLKPAMKGQTAVNVCLHHPAVHPTCPQGLLSATRCRNLGSELSFNIGGGPGGCYPNLLSPSICCFRMQTWRTWASLRGAADPPFHVPSPCNPTV